MKKPREEIREVPEDQRLEVVEDFGDPNDLMPYPVQTPDESQERHEKAPVKAQRPLKVIDAQSKAAKYIGGN